MKEEPKKIQSAELAALAIDGSLQSTRHIFEEGVRAPTEVKVFDWEKAAKIIRERKATSASAGLSGDWIYTAGEILKDGKPVPEDETYTFLTSTFSTPALEIDGERIECYRIQTLCDETHERHIGGYWPPEALELLVSNEESEVRSDDSSQASCSLPTCDEADTNGCWWEDKQIGLRHKWYVDGGNVATCGQCGTKGLLVLSSRVH